MSRFRRGLEQLLRLHADTSKSLEMNWFQALSVAAEAMDVRLSGVWLFDSTRRHLRSRVIYDRATRQIRENLVLDRADHVEYFRTLETERVLAAEEIVADPRTQSFKAYSERWGITSMLDAPLFRNGLMIGVVCYEDIQSPRKWTTEEVDFAQASTETFVRIIETLDHALLFEQLATRNAELQAAFDSTADWMMTLDRDNRVQVINRPFIAFWQQIQLATNVGDVIVPALCPVSAIVAAEASKAWQGATITRKLTHKLPNGKTLSLEVSVYPVSTARGVERLLVHVGDESGRD